MNALLGEKLSIITPKAQTTRHRILGILSEKDYQLVFSDTPGIMQPKYKMQEAMMKFVDSAFEDADVFLLVTDVTEDFNNDAVIERLNNSKAPVLVLVNKIDLSEQNAVAALLLKWKEKLPDAEVVPVSALKKFNLQKILESVIEHIPENPPYFDKDEMSDRPEKFFVAEILREKIFLNYEKEIPYSCEVSIDTFNDEVRIVKIRATIFVTRDSQKGIIIGNKGEALKRTATAARKEMENFLQKKVFLEVIVKVSKDWRNNELQLKKFGYIFK